MTPNPKSVCAYPGQCGCSSCPQCFHHATSFRPQSETPALEVEQFLNEIVEIAREYKKRVEADCEKRIAAAEIKGMRDILPALWHSGHTGNEWGCYPNCPACSGENIKEARRSAIREFSESLRKMFDESMTEDWKSWEISSEIKLYEDARLADRRGTKRGKERRKGV